MNKSDKQLARRVINNLKEAGVALCDDRRQLKMAVGFERMVNESIYKFRVEITE